MQDHGQLGQATTVVADLPCGPAGMGDRQLLEDAEAWEALGRLVDARRVAIWRVRSRGGPASSSASTGSPDGPVTGTRPTCSRGSC